MGQRKFLVNALVRGTALGPEPVPVTIIATLEPGEAFDESTVLDLQHLILEQNHGAVMARVLGFSPLEDRAPATAHGLRESTGARVEYPLTGWPGEGHKLNSGCVLPPVDCPLLIELEPGVVIRASRPTFAQSKGDQLVFTTESGLTITGRPRWSYP